MADKRDPQRQDTETHFAHAGGCLGPVYFEIAGGFCWQCGAGPLAPYVLEDGYTLWRPGQPAPHELSAAHA